MSERFVTCGPNEALVVSGCCYSKPTLFAGGCVFLCPFQQVQRITLNTMTLTVQSPKVYTLHGVPLTATGVAQVKVQGQNKEMLRAACEQLLGKSEQEIMHIARETLECHQRAVMGSMTVEEICFDRKKFNRKVFEVASADLVNMGISVVSYTLKDVIDKKGYLKSLGLARTAEVKRDARIGEAEAQRDASIEKALAEEQRMSSYYLNRTEIAKAEQNYELKKATYDIEVNTKKADCDSAYALQAAKTKQRIKEEEIQIKVVEKTQEVQLQEQEILRKEKALESAVHRPAEAEKFKLETIAEANRKKVVLEAEAEAEALKLKGEATAFAIQTKAKAEAEQMAKKADAFKEYGDAAKLQLMMEVLPKVAAEVAAPLSQCKKIVMVSTDEEVGASKLVGEVVDIITKTTDMVTKLVGVNLQDLNRHNCKSNVFI